LKRVSPKVLVFIISVTSLAVATLVEIDCPICRGSGYLISTGGSSRLHVVEARFVNTYVGCPCSSYEMSYIVRIAVSNEDSNGTRAFLLIRVFDKADALQGETIQGVYVDANATMAMNVHVKAFEVQTITEPPVVLVTLWGPERRMAPCSTCQTTGKVSLVKWLILMVGTQIR